MQINYKTVALWRQRFSVKDRIVFGKWLQAADANRNYRQRRLRKLLTPLCKPSLQEPRTGVAGQWPISKA